ncbi:hypothetical protein GJU40_13730 [Bacillus lacus]|uniref:Uncharacterized protein n=1 Tax=Metabacillus lacus TaxID=1983721 RepID=A0A7X2LY39_9BACI|nr:hypothetical protein [Metabacillus lacus]MRX73205.1 hypothetical protein [Metabacillus lacus]
MVEKNSFITELKDLARDQMANAQNRLEIAEALENNMEDKELLEKIEVLYRENRDLFQKSAELESRLFHSN